MRKVWLKILGVLAGLIIATVPVAAAKTTDNQLYYRYWYGHNRTAVTQPTVPPKITLLKLVFQDQFGGPR